MSLPPAPLRFLLLVVGCWTGVRAFTLLPNTSEALDQTAEDVLVPSARATPTVPVPFSPALPGATLETDDWSPRSTRRPPQPWPLPIRPRSPDTRTASSRLIPQAGLGPAATVIAAAPSWARDRPRGAAPAPTAPPAFNLAPRRPNDSRWAGSAWAFVREQIGGGALAPGGTLGGNQAGARLTYRLNNDSRRAISLSARLYTPLDNLQGAEAALGIDWRPIASLPINLLAERRQAIGRDGRSDFALMLYGGTETRIASGRLRIEGYGQAGIVGIEARDLFADGAITATTRIGPVDVGGGAWGGAQPGVTRLDLGPHAGLRLRVGRVTVRAATEWRFRVAGDAAPGSGPSLTLSAGF